ncbi:sensor histidine kinase, partial [Arcanobacterium phocae]|uniref:sensor histidine kinase n=1 Tax=Arcanobacterium phocae TaxID=131112 RepID=UPI001C11D317
QFTADASHELRGPITTIKASAEVIRTHPERIHPADAGKIQGILSASEQMSRLVEDLLLLARVDSAPRQSIERGDAIPLDELLEDAIDFLELKAEEKEQTLQFQVFQPVSVRWNPARLQRLFSNLIDNAIKYTPDGGKITVTLDRNDKFALVRIEDTGIGIAKEHIPLVFDRFWREESARSYQDGSGLGLAICRS